MGAGTPVAYGPAAIYQEDPCQRGAVSVLSLVKGRAIQGLLANGGLVLRPEPRVVFGEIVGRPRGWQLTEQGRVSFDSAG